MIEKQEPDSPDIRVGIVERNAIRAFVNAIPVGIGQVDFAAITDRIAQSIYWAADRRVNGALQSPGLSGVNTPIAISFIEGQQQIAAKIRHHDGSHPLRTQGGVDRHC